MDSILKLIKKFTYILYILIIAWILVLNIKNCFNIKNVFVLGIIPLLFLFVFLIVKKEVSLKSNRVLILIFIFLFFVILFIGLKTRVGLSWDYGGVMKRAFNSARNLKYDKTYFARYPNNILFFLISTFIYKFLIFVRPQISLHGIQTATIIVNTFIIIISMTLIYFLSVKKFNNNFSLLTLLLMIIFVPFYLFVTIFYTDIISYLFTIIPLVLYFLFTYIKSSKKKHMILIMITLIVSLGFKLKATNLFVAIAIIIQLILNKDFKSGIFMLLYTLLFLFVVSFAINKAYPISKAEIKMYSFPYTHWIMMSLNKNATGGYITEDEYFTAKFKTLDEKKEANIAEIKSRVNEYGVIGLTRRIFVTKAKRSWNNPTFSTDEYLSRETECKSKLCNVFALGGKYNEVYTLIIQSIYIFIIIGAFISGLINIKNNNDIIYISQLCIVGIFIFLCFWECNSRYVIIFLPFLLLLSSYGHYNIVLNLMKRRNNNV